LAFEKGVLAFENRILAFEKGVLAFENGDLTNRQENKQTVKQTDRQTGLRDIKKYCRFPIGVYTTVQPPYKSISYSCPK
jgi:hypothetical protein